MKMHKLILFFFLIFSSNLYSQGILSVERLSVGGNFNTGNSESFQITSKATVMYENKEAKNGIIFSPDYFILYTGNNTEFIKKSEDFRADFFGWKDLSKGYSIIAFSDIEHSYAKKIDLRVAGGIGIKKVINFKNLKSSTSIAPLYDEMFIRGARYSSTRISLRQSVSFTILDVNVSGMLLYQPSIISSSDLNLSDNTNSALNLEVSKKFSQKISLGIQYDSWYSSLPSIINNNVNRLDQRVSFSIIYRR